MPTPMSMVREVLERDRAVVAEAVAQAIPRSEPQRYLYELVADYPSRAGKAFRASLCLATSRAFGGSTEATLEVAVALEMLHNAFLVHDDIEDGSLRRRGRPTLHVLHGTALALNAGDALCALALEAAARSASRQPPAVAGRLLGELAHLFRRSVEGQAWELGWIAEARFDVTEADYLRMVLAKTCWYSTIHPCRLGALVGAQGRAALDPFVPFGFYLGAAFQVRDDLDNLAPGSHRYGKDVGGDLLEGKRTIPLLHLLATASPAQRRRARDLIDGVDGIGDAERIDELLAMMRLQGSLEHARDVADELARLALRALPAAYAGATDRSEVDYVASLVLLLCGAIRAEDTAAVVPAGG